MKKIYSTLALAMAVAFSGSAAVKEALHTSANARLSEKKVEFAGNAKNIMKKVSGKVTAKKAEKIEDLYGIYTFVYADALDEAGLTDVISPEIKASSKGGNNVVVTNLPFSDIELEAVIDLDNSTFSIPQQDAVYNPTYQEMMIFTTESASNNTDKYPAPADGALTGVINEDGSIEFPMWYMACYRISKGYFWAAFDIQMSPLETYTFNPSDWTEAGVASYTDGFMSPGFLESGAVAPAYNVTLLKNRTIPGEYAVKNPYGLQSIFAEVNERPDAEGYIVFNIEHPDCVLVRPLVQSGMWIDNSEANDGSMIEDTYCYNTEGRRVYINGEDVQDIIDEVYIILDEEAGETFADYLSTYDVETNTVTILGTNTYFSFQSSPLSQYYWTQQVEGESVRRPMNTTIVLPEGTGAVDEIGVDANAPVEYYNLQGVKVLNPEAGTLVIKKQGSKVSKLIVK